MVKTIHWIQNSKTTETEINKDKDGKVLHKLMNNAIHGKAMEKDMSHKTCDNNLFEIGKIKLALKLNKPA